jgi:hypothetical protein
VPLVILFESVLLLQESEMGGTENSVFDNMSLHPGVKFVPRVKLCPLRFTPGVNTLLFRRLEGRKEDHHPGAKFTLRD